MSNFIVWGDNKDKYKFFFYLMQVFYSIGQGILDIRFRISDKLQEIGNFGYSISDMLRGIGWAIKF
ncbi:MAG: hypothetical protein RLZZ292_2309 [Bacteroidota bacterium]|jgi:predicted acetyltransferase